MLAVVGLRPAADLVWAITTAAVTAVLVVTVVADLLRRRPGVDLIALLAMAGALALGEYLAGAVIAVMLTGGQVLEEYAAGPRSSGADGAAQRCAADGAPAGR